MMIQTSLETYTTYKKELDSFAQRWNLSELQLSQFIRYIELLLDHSERFNITTITSVSDILDYHFSDSLELAKHLDLSGKGLVDVGSGGGFPGVPLKIFVPASRWTLVEVNQKKLQFLQTVIDELQLQDIEVCDSDWRNFLRMPDLAVDYVCARASLQPEELLRVLKPGCIYNKSTVIYWAAASWQPQKLEAPLVDATITYHVGTRQRQLVLFKGSSQK